RGRRRAGLLEQSYPAGRGARGARVGGVADQVHEQIVQGVGVTLQIQRLERGVKLERELLLLQDAALEGAARAHHTHGVESLGARQSAPRPVLHRAEEADRPVEVLDHLTQLVEQLGAAAPEAWSGPARPPTAPPSRPDIPPSGCPARWRYSSAAGWRRRPASWCGAWGRVRSMPAVPARRGSTLPTR